MRLRGLDSAPPGCRSDRFKDEDRNLNRDRAAASRGGTVRSDGAAMEFRQLSRQSEPDAQARRTALGCIALNEEIEHVR